MKVCIVTVYNSINSGSYWQAKALGMALEKMGIEVVYFKRKNNKGSSSSRFSKVKEFLKKSIKYGIKEGKRQINMFKEFENVQKDFNVISNKDKYLKEIDYFILGSDTIWNLESKYFLNNYKIYFGDIFKGYKVISYAASVGNTSLEFIKKFKDIPKMLNELKHISVRDVETLKMVENLSDKKSVMVCDPTLLISKTEYRELEKKERENKYIFLYLFSELSEKHIMQLKKFAKQRGLKIISGVTCPKYADECIVNAPNTFLNYMLYADYIITDTFHGTIFSINLEKNFVVMDRNKKKVSDVMEKFDLENRIIRENSNIEEIFENKLNFKDNEEKIIEMRKESLKFLKESLK